MLKLDRRKALGLSVAGVAALRIAASRAATSSPLQVVVNLNGAAFTFSEDQGHDLGDFVSSIGGFTQRCVRATASGCPLTVFFRPDRTSDRAEVVFELGTLFGGTPVNLGAYTVTISRGGQQLAQVNVPQHYWFSRWRWQSAHRPIVGSVADLVSQNLLPPIGRSVAGSSSGSTGTTSGATPTTGSTTTSGGSTSATTTGAGSTTTGSATTSGSPSTSSGSTSTGSTSTSGSTWTTFSKTLIKPISAGPTASAAALPDGTFVGAGLISVGFTKSLTPPSTTGSTSGTTTTTTPSTGTTTSPSPSPSTGTTSTTTGGSTTTPSTTTGGSTTSTGTTSTTTPTTSGSSTSGSTTTSSSTTTGVTVPAAGYDISAYTVMGLAGVYAYMPTTGERPDIGLVTEQQGQYLATGSQAMLNAVMAQAEAAGSMPWHMRDENTGAPINFETYPNKTWYPDAYGPDKIQGTTNPVVIDTSHVPALTYVPYLLTGDPYFLEELQFQSNWDWGAMPPSYRPSIPQARHFAWAMRSLFQVTRQTSSSAPAWLLPQTYWFNRLQGMRQWFEANYVNATRPDRSVFRACTPIDSSSDEGPTSPAGTWIAVWQDEFVACVLGWGVLMGFRDWQTSFDWKIGSTIARTNGASGWVRAQATPYRVILRDTATSSFVTTWAAGYAETARINGITYADPNTWAPSDMTYLGYTRGALVYAAALGTPGASASLAWATGQLTAKGWNTDYKWRLGTGL